MRFTIIVLFLCLTCAISTSAQAPKPYGVKGNVIDSAGNAHLTNSVVCVLNAKDSTLRKFVRTTSGGAFNIGGLVKGKFILLVSYPGYADYVEHFTLDSAHAERNFGKVNLLLKSRILQDVIIKGTAAAIKIKGDTTEFNAAAFKIQPNSKVEDLLKQLPGITVDKDGKITAQGQTVPKVLVDGEEFFGDDPTLVTKNIRADMVDKVQLYDKKSDQAAFTGIDDGQKTKTINIKLKEDKKNGYFGKVEAAAGTKDFYQNQLMFNKFKGKQKFSAYGILANTGKVGLGWQDQNKYGSGSNMQFSDDGGMFFSFGGGGGDLDSFSGQYDGRGIPVARTGGVHYDNKWDSDKQSINVNYKIGSMGVDGTTGSEVQYKVPGGTDLNTQNTVSSQSFNNSVFRQKADLQYQTKLDTASTLKVNVDGTLRTNKTATHDLGSTVNGANTKLNDNDRTLTNDVDAKVVNISAFYTHKFKKDRRTFTWNLSEAYNESNAKGFLNSIVNFYNKTTGNLDSTQKINQFKTADIKSSVFSSNMTYTEPLSKSWSLLLNYGIGLNNSSADRKSLNQTAPGVYNQLDRTFSNDYVFNQLSNQGGAMFNYKSTKATFIVGTKATAVNFKQIDQYTNNTYRRSFLNWNPQANYQYRFSQQRSFRIDYNGNNTQPTIDQIQPVRVNNDPLNQVEGNPDLKPSFTHRFNTSYSSYKVLSDEWMNMYGSFSFQDNAIVNSTVNSENGARRYRSVNLSGHTPYNYNVGAYYSRKIKALADLNVGPNIYVNGSKNFAYVTYNNVEQLNVTNNNSIRGELSLQKYKTKKYDFWIGGGPGYTFSTQSLTPAQNNNGYTFNLNGSGNLYLPGKIQLSTDGNYEYQGKTQSFDQPFSRVLINARIIKSFLKDETLKFTVSGNDLLNQNTGFRQYASGNTTSRTTYTTIRRYFMFTISWDFNKMGGGVPAQK